MVSVPYRGATFLNPIQATAQQLLIQVSVPYRGATFLNCGVMSTLYYEYTRFRPLSGSYISQYNQNFVQNIRNQVSVPYRGATFLNY